MTYMSIKYAGCNGQVARSDCEIARSRSANRMQPIDFIKLAFLRVFKEEQMSVDNNKEGRLGKKHSREQRQTLGAQEPWH